MLQKQPTLKKIYQVSRKHGAPRLWLQHLVCEAAGWEPGEKLFVVVAEDEIQVTNEEVGAFDHCIHAASRKSPSSGKQRPLVDTAGDRYRTLIDYEDKVEMTVYRNKGKGTVVIRPLAYQLDVTTTVSTQRDQRLRLTSIFAGAGIGTAIAKSTGFYTPIQEIEFDSDSCESLLWNFPNSYIVNADVRDVQEMLESDVALVTSPCDEHSLIGNREENIFSNLNGATVKLLQSAKPKVIIMENVPHYYKSQTYLDLKEMLLHDWPYVEERNMESIDFGSIARRNRTYAVYFATEDLFNHFSFPKPPKTIKRKKLKAYLDTGNREYLWKSVDKWMESFQSRDAWKNRGLEKTFVNESSKEIQCITKRYRGQCASSSMLLHPENPKLWRHFTITELKRILSIPDWFEFPVSVPMTRQFEMIGQSLDGRIFSSILNAVGVAFMKVIAKANSWNKEAKERKPLIVGQNGQLALF